MQYDGPACDISPNAEVDLDIAGLYMDELGDSNVIACEDEAVITQMMADYLQDLGD
jgi:hypothetical protein